MKLLIIGDRSHELSAWAISMFPHSKLLTNDNFDDVKKPSDIFYTSASDLNYFNFIEAVNKADDVILHKPESGQWSDDVVKQTTDLWLRKTEKYIENIRDPANLLEQTDDRKTQEKQIWSCGCSFSAGYGLEDIDSRYGQLIANELNLPISFLANPGTSISWAADQILRANIKKNDIVIWGITSIERFMLFHKNKIFNVLNLSIDDDNYDYSKDLMQKKLVDSDRIMYAIKNIFQVDNFCKLIGANLILFPHHNLSLAKSEKILLDYITPMDNCIKPSAFVDYTNDKLHPGPMTHSNWANEISEFIKVKELLN
jgi:hypothetical protein